MSELSFLEKLLEGADVEWKPLGEIAFFNVANRGRKPVKASLRVAGETPYYGANNIQDYVDGFTHDGEYVLIAEDGSKSLENYSIQYTTRQFWANNHIHVVGGTDAVNTRYLYHYLCIVNFIPFLTGGGRAKLTKGQLIQISVPIPCPDNPKRSLEIQAEIVRILDNFTELTAELTAELDMRKKQYNYYRDQLLSFDDTVEWKPLGEVLNLRNGYTPSKKKPEYWNNGDVPWFRMEDLRTNGNILSNSIQHCHSRGIKGKLFPANSIIMATTATIGEHALVNVEYMSNQQFTNFTLKEEFHKLLNMKFLYYYFFILDRKVKGSVNMSSFPSVQMSKLKKYKIPVPSLEEQARIVAILDKFDALTNSISEGLPREIELRQKQYEYYRDLLLNFPKPKEKKYA